MNYCFCPFIGLGNSGYITTKRVELTKDGILLPRYEKTAKESIDFLNESADFSNTEDVYRGFKFSSFPPTSRIPTSLKTHISMPYLMIIR